MLARGTLAPSKLWPFVQAKARIARTEHAPVRLVRPCWNWLKEVCPLEGQSAEREFGALRIFGNRSFSRAIIGSDHKRARRARRLDAKRELVLDRIGRGECLRVFKLAARLYVHEAGILTVSCPSSAMSFSSFFKAPFLFNAAGRSSHPAPSTSPLV